MKKHLLTISKKVLAVVLISLTTYTVSAQYGENLETNGDIEQGQGDWDLKFYGGVEGEISVDETGGVDGSKAIKIVVTAGGNMNKLSLVSPAQNNLPIAQYLVKASVKADGEYGCKLGWLGTTDGTIEEAHTSGMKASITYPQVAPKDFTLGSEYKTLKGLVINRDIFNFIDNYRIQMGDSEGTYWFDNYTLQKVEGFANASFEDEDDFLFGWTKIVNGSASAEFSKEETDVVDGNTALKVDVTASNDTAHHVQLSSEYAHFVEAGKEYEFSFSAKAANEGDSIWIAATPFTYSHFWGEKGNGDPTYKGIYNSGLNHTDSVALTTVLSEYKFTYTFADTVDYVRFKINLGNQVSTYVLDNFKTGEAGSVNIKASTLNKVSVFPNPANDVIFVKYAEGAQLNIYDLAGKQLLGKIISSEQGSLNISELNKGMYIVSVKNGNELYTSKLVVE